MTNKSPWPLKLVSNAQSYMPMVYDDESQYKTSIINLKFVFWICYLSAKDYWFNSISNLLAVDC